MRVKEDTKERFRLRESLDVEGIDFGDFLYRQLFSFSSVENR